jgi:hypothetical protein
LSEAEAQADRSIAASRAAILRDNIKSLFGSGQPPAKESITPCVCEECLGIRDLLDGVTWIEFARFEEPFDTWALLSGEAFRYFLPGGLLWSIDRNGETCEMEQSLAIHLSSLKNRDPGMQPYHRERFSGFTAEQQIFLHDWLEHDHSRSPTVSNKVWQKQMRQLGEYWPAIEPFYTSGRG